MSSGWTCQRCTYKHFAPGDRCVMCLELRITKKQMAGFIQGIPVDEDSCSRKKRSPIKAKKEENEEVVAKIDDKIVHTAQDQSKNNNKSSFINPYLNNAPQRKPINHQAQASFDGPRSTFAAPSVKQQGFITQNRDNSVGAKRGQQDNRESVSAQLQLQPHTVPQQPHTMPQQKQQQQPLNRNQHSTVVGPKCSPPVQHQQPHHPKLYQAVHNNYQPGPVPLDEDCKAEWIFPKNDLYPRRQYQFDIARTAIMHNTLVGLPTGLGKTLIAAVVMYNFYRWFPTGKVVFMAPTLPLVNQQVRACFEIMGIPERDTAILTGKMTPDKRASVWDARRAFFCTPQTMQKDIDQGRVDPKHVVLVVFDEAHRARGDYAYNKIIQQLEQREARFRVLGLSATPGSKIKIIQEVVTSLRISKVECRTDEDPDVKQYTHDRQTEVVLVKQASASKEVEMAINEILEPEIAKLRRAQALSYFGHATLTAWMVMKAREEWIKQGRSQGLNAQFEVVRTFVELRSLLHQQGVGVVRSKLIRLRDDPKWGLGTVVQSERFQNLMTLILKSTCDPNSKKASVEAKVMNNPKLQKLQEILTEHFERARLNEFSSRAIVFSQYRDSVKEIVNVLNASRPMVRPRHFVGQGKGASKETRAENGGPTDVMKGMTQMEQHQVIKQFRENVYNVLVCTCIGEEGLDIGEVDLIVNFDSLQSPVRMVQRVGRTGRKRDGRVVFLIAEGSEEKTYKEAKSKERTIMRAMKRPDAFSVVVSPPLLPVTPIAREMNMIKAQAFHMSQVEGLGESKRQPGQFTSKSKSWRLSDDDEARRAAALGDSNKVKTARDDSAILAIRKRLLSARQYNPDSFLLSTRPLLGRISLFLRDFETCTIPPGKRPRRSTQPRGRSILPEIDFWFPLTRSEAYFEAMAWGEPNQRHIVGAPSSSSGLDHPVAHVTDGKVATSSEFRKTDGGTTILVDDGVRSQKSDRRDALSTEGPDPDRLGSRERDVIRKGNATSADNNVVVGELYSGPLVAGTDNDGVNSGPVARDNRSDGPPENAFELPTQSSSSDEDDQSDGDDQADSGVQLFNTSQDDSFARTRDGMCDTGADSVSAKDQKAGAQCRPDPLPEGQPNAEHGNQTQSFKDSAFSLPAQDLSSSSQDESDSESCQTQSSIIKMRENNKNPASNPHAKSDKLHDGKTKRKPTAEDNSDDSSIHGWPKIARSKKRKVIIDDDDDHGHDDGPSGAVVESTTIGAKLGIHGLFDTQETPGHSHGDDIVCAVCKSGESPDEDPIYLCDGPGKGVECHLAVHATCYSATIPSSDEEWRCDPCAHRFMGGSEDLRCVVCGVDQGPLKRLSKGKWAHCFCTQTRHPSKPVVRMKKAIPKKRHWSHFLEEEASIESDEDMDGDDAEEDDIADIEEEEEFHSSFINDSSQLGYSPEAPGDDEDPQGDGIHRAVDEERARENEFKTPILNRRMKRRNRRSSNSQRHSDAGLGEMNFIRSVIEHHRQGGTAEDIEQAYEQLEAEVGDEEEPAVPQRPEPNRTIMEYNEQDSEDEWPI